MIYMPGGRSLVNNSIFNLVLMLARFSPTSSPSFPTFIRSLYVFVLSRRRFLLCAFPLSFSLIYFLPSFLSSALIPPCRRPDKGEISTGRANKFLHRRQVRRVLSTSASRNQKRRNSEEEKRVFHV